MYSLRKKVEKSTKTKENFTMQIYEELKARGLIAQVTDEEEIREMVNNGKAVFYIGFDPPPTLSMWATLWPCA